MWKVAEDAIVGEVKVAEQIAQDLTGNASMEGFEISAPVKKF